MARYYLEIIAYDPVWMVCSHDPAFVRLGIVLLCTLVPAVSVGIVFPRKWTILVSGLGVLAWIFFSVMTRLIVFA